MLQNVVLNFQTLRFGVGKFMICVRERVNDRFTKKGLCSKRYIYVCFVQEVNHRMVYLRIILSSGIIYPQLYLDWKDLFSEICHYGARQRVTFKTALSNRAGCQ